MQPIGSDLDERWSQLLDGALDDSARGELLAIAAAELNQVVAERDGDTRGLLDGIGAVTDQPLTERLWDDANRAFELALGVNPARLINWLVLDSAYAQRLADVRSMLDPPAMAFLTDLLVRFGDRLERASYLLVTHSEHDWRLINREISVDRATARITIRLKISKYNGEVLLIEGRPDSILTLADAVLAAVTSVGDRTAFLQDLGPFMETVEQTIAMFTSDEPESSEEPELPTSAIVGRAAVPGAAVPGVGVAPGSAVAPPAPTPYR